MNTQAGNGTALTVGQRVQVPANCFDAQTKSTKPVSASVVNPRRPRRGEEATALLRCEEGAFMGRTAAVPLRLVVV